MIALLILLLIFIICFAFGGAVKITIGSLLLWGAGNVIIKLFGLNLVLTFGWSWLIIFAIWALFKLIDLLF